MTTLSDNEWSEAAIARPDSVEVERVGRLEDLREDWLLLEEAADHPFATWEWNSQWWRHFGGDRELLALVCRGSTTGQPVAIVPLRPDRVGPVRVARFLGDGDLRGPVCRAADRPAVAAAVRAAVQAGDLGRCRLLLAERLPGGQSWGEMLGGRRVATHPDPLLSLGGIDWEEFLGARSRNFRQQVRRRERRLVEEHGLSFRLSSDRGRWGADLDSLFRLHALRWGGRGTGVFAGERGRFHRAFALAAGERGWLRLWLAEIDGEAVAAWYGWRFADSEWYYQAGRDPRYDDLSLGFVLLAHTVREACVDRVDAYRFLDGAEPYKRRFATEDRRAESVVLGRGASGRLGALGAAVAVRLRPALRRLAQVGMPEAAT